MTIKNGDKSAMPNQALGTDGLPTHEAEFGLTKREMMAMHMMAALVGIGGICGDEKYIAEMAARSADALLAELGRTK